MPTKFKFTDEAAAIAFVESLETQLEKAGTDLSAATASVSTLTGERDKARTDLAAEQGKVTAFTGERDSLKAGNETLTKENTKLKEDMADFDKRVATELAKHGIRSEAAQTGTDKAGKGEKLSATAEILQAKGVSSLAELEAKRK